MRGHRDGIGLTLGELAERVGLTAIDCLRIEVGEMDPTTEQIADLADALGQPTHELLSLGAEWEDDYVDAAVSHLGPMSAEEVAQAARVLARRSAS